MVEVVVTRKFQVTIPKEVREALGISVGDRLIVKVVDGKIVMEPIRGSDALRRLSTIADRFLGGPRRVDVVRLVEKSLKEETSLH
ncbi:MAG: AbrB/MazE/SpoVT family DNA-binding domain-containing protein [Thermoprotei archaeon]|nr:MAG: AbrB/MazE/SpoVT family DNA-binding domain-containing protein [Thermoprotei archaeon]RLF23918.1 MAG: AbrB/MazE/SpoVT family DNA-binding domain-containing protein [Thermoprotei archaeon]